MGAEDRIQEINNKIELSKTKESVADLKKALATAQELLESERVKAEAADKLRRDLIMVKSQVRQIAYTLDGPIKYLEETKHTFTCSTIKRIRERLLKEVEENEEEEV